SRHLSLHTTCPPPTSTLFPYTTLFRSEPVVGVDHVVVFRRRERLLAHEPGGERLHEAGQGRRALDGQRRVEHADLDRAVLGLGRSEEHTSELQSPYDLVCRLLLEKKKN